MHKLNRRSFLAAAGLATVLFDTYLSEARTPVTFHSVPVPVLNSIPVVGGVFDQPLLGYLAFAPLRINESNQAMDALVPRNARSPQYQPL